MSSSVEMLVGIAECIRLLLNWAAQMVVAHAVILGAVVVCRDTHNTQVLR
jgi:hypothetical protein